MDAKKTRASIRRVNKGKPILSQPAYAGIEVRMRKFLDTYAETGRLLRACEKAGIAFRTHYRKLESDAIYRAAFEEAEQHAAQHIEDKVYDMAMDDELQAAVVLLRRFRPQHYRERASLDVSGSLDLVTALTEARNRMIAFQSDADVSKAS